MKSVRVVIEGRVQGVAFRDWTRRTAQGFGVEGWVRNRRDGSVEALFCGNPETVDQMLAASRDGPPAAKVSAVRIVEEDAAPEIGFRVLPTT